MMVIASLLFGALSGQLSTALDVARTTKRKKGKKTKREEKNEQTNKLNKDGKEGRRKSSHGTLGVWLLHYFL